MTDLVERLRQAHRNRFIPVKNIDLVGEAAAEIKRLLDDSRMLALCEGDRKEMTAEIERLRAERDERTAEIARLLIEVEEWKDRWAAERRDHEATIKEFDKMVNEGPP